MKARIMLLVVALATIMSVGFSATADHGCNGTVTSAGAGYIDARSTDPTTATSTWWFYAETNGTAGLQSGGEAISGLYSDSCSHANPDQLLY